MAQRTHPPRGHFYHYISPSPVARRLFWHVLGIGKGWFDGPTRLEAFNRPGAVILWIESGTARLKLGSETYELKKGPLFWLFSLQQARVFTPLGGKTLITRSIRFAGPNVAAWLEELAVAEKPEFRVSPSWASGVHATQRKLLRLVTEQPPRWEGRVHTMLAALLQKFLVLRSVVDPAERHLPEPITRALDALEADPSRDWKVSELSSRAGLNYSSFRELFRQHVRETVHEYLQRHRVDLAQALLADQRLQIKEIAERLHFNSEYYFSHFFRTKTGMSPTEFRRHLGTQGATRAASTD